MQPGSIITPSQYSYTQLVWSAQENRYIAAKTKAADPREILRQRNAQNEQQFTRKSQELSSALARYKEDIIALFGRPVVGEKTRFPDLPDHIVNYINNTGDEPYFAFWEELKILCGLNDQYNDYDAFLRSPPQHLPPKWLSFRSIVDNIRKTREKFLKSVEFDYLGRNQTTGAITISHRGSAPFLNKTQNEDLTDSTKVSLPVTDEKALEAFHTMMREPEGLLKKTVQQTEKSIVAHDLTDGAAAAHTMLYLDPKGHVKATTAVLGDCRVYAVKVDLAQLDAEDEKTDKKTDTAVTITSLTPELHGLKRNPSNPLEGLSSNEATNLLKRDNIAFMWSGSTWYLCGPIELPEHGTTTAASLQQLLQKSPAPSLKTLESSQCDFLVWRNGNTWHSKIVPVSNALNMTHSYGDRNTKPNISSEPTIHTTDLGKPSQDSNQLQFVWESSDGDDLTPEQIKQVTKAVVKQEQKDYKIIFAAQGAKAADQFILEKIAIALDAKAERFDLEQEIPAEDNRTGQILSYRALQPGEIIFDSMVDAHGGDQTAQLACREAPQHFAATASRNFQLFKKQKPTTQQNEETFQTLTRKIGQRGIFYSRTNTFQGDPTIFQLHLHELAERKKQHYQAILNFVLQTSAPDIVTSSEVKNSDEFSQEQDEDDNFGDPIPRAIEPTQPTEEEDDAQDATEVLPQEVVRTDIPAAQQTASIPPGTQALANTGVSFLAYSAAFLPYDEQLEPFTVAEQDQDIIQLVNDLSHFSDPAQLTTIRQYKPLFDQLHTASRDGLDSEVHTAFIRQRTLEELISLRAYRAYHALSKKGKHAFRQFLSSLAYQPPQNQTLDFAQACPQTQTGIVNVSTSPLAINLGYLKSGNLMGAALLEEKQWHQVLTEVTNQLCPASVYSQSEEEKTSPVNLGLAVIHGSKIFLANNNDENYFYAVIRRKNGAVVCYRVTANTDLKTTYNLQANDQAFLINTNYRYQSRLVPRQNSDTANLADVVKKYFTTDVTAVVPLELSLYLTNLTLGANLKPTSVAVTSINAEDSLNVKYLLRATANAPEHAAAARQCYKKIDRALDHAIYPRACAACEQEIQRLGAQNALPIYQARASTLRQLWNKTSELDVDTPELIESTRRATIELAVQTKNLNLDVTTVPEISAQQDKIKQDHDKKISRYAYDHLSGRRNAMKVIAVILDIIYGCTGVGTVHQFLYWRRTGQLGKIYHNTERRKLIRKVKEEQEKQKLYQVQVEPVVKAPEENVDQVQRSALRYRTPR